MSIEGVWNVKMSTPMGEQTVELTLIADGDTLSGSMSSPMGRAEFSGGSISGNDLTWITNISAMGTEIAVNCTATVDGDQIKGVFSSNMGSMNFMGTRS